MGNIQILLRQHVGAPCAPIVKAGDEVKKGTLIATPTGLGANIFSSVYGVVEEVKEDRTIHSLGKVFAKKIIPLLQEYFYEDYEKIRLILGDNQKKNEEPLFIEAVKVNDKSIVTSGTYQRYYEHDNKLYHHIIDCKTGMPAETASLVV